MFDPLANKPMSPIETFQLFQAAVDFADYFVRKLDQYEKEQRYDDNQKKMLVQALRMYEQGQISKEALKTIIDLLPDAIPVQAVEVKKSDDVDIAELLKKLSK